MKGGEFSGRIGLLLAIGLPVFILAYVNLAIFPLTTSHPNYSDVDRVFNRFQFPANWQVTQEHEEKGYGGRRCSFEQGPSCYHKSVYFAIPTNVTVDDVKQVLLKGGCAAVQEEISHMKAEDITQRNFLCTIEGLRVGSGFDFKQNHLYVQVST